MSDGALSQDEIDALLAGVDSSGFGASSPASSGGGASSSRGGPNEADRKALQDFLVGTVSSQSSNLSMMTGADCSIQPPRVDVVSRDEFLQNLPDMAVVVKANYVEGFEGEHLLVLGEDEAKRIASLMNREENIELDDMAMSVLGEVVSQITGTEITALSDKTGNKGIQSEPPQASLMPKGMASLPGGDFSKVSYMVDLGDGAPLTMWEVFSPSLTSSIARALSSSDMGSMGAAAAMGGSMMGAQGGGFPGFGSNPMGGGAPMGAPMGGAMSANPFGNAFGGAPGAQGFGGPSAMMGGGATNVQSVQFPNLMPQNPHLEQGNIGLIMDVYMEMTVELGRTRKLIKEILGMGEGTIIELDKLAGEPVDILVNHKLIAKGEVVVIDENFGVRVTEIVSPMERMSDMG